MKSHDCRLRVYDGAGGAVIKSEATPVAILCSAGRPEMLHLSVLAVAKQTVPCSIVLSVTKENDVLPETQELPGVSVHMGSRGLCRQRNLALQRIEHKPECVLFFDDDVELDAEYVGEILACYRQHPSVAIVNGRNLAHGLYPAGTVDRAIAQRLLASDRERLASAEIGSVTPMKTSYGCRMSMRGTLLGEVNFDERLVLYGFLEDLDFAFQCKRFGAIAESNRALGVHLEVASNRMGLKRRGYSDIINPLYICSKQTGFPLHRALLGAMYRMLGNAVVSVRERDFQWLAGNLIGWRDAMRGKLEPERILEFSD